jgi:hypothetical protein
MMKNRGYGQDVTSKIEVGKKDATSR